MQPAVVPVHTLLAQEKSGSSTKALYLIATSETDPEVYEVEIQQPPTREDWITGLREAVDACPYDNDDEGMVVRVHHLSGEKKTKLKIVIISRIFSCSDSFFRMKCNM